MAGNRDSVKILGIKGINQQEKLADPALELADARNLWAPNGRLEKRPGFWGVAAYSPNTTTVTDGETRTIIKETPIGTFSTTGDLSSLAVNRRYYLGFSAILDWDADELLGVEVSIVSANSNEMSARFEYWNGKEWAPLNVFEGDASVEDHLEAATDSIWSFAWPRDFAKTTVNSVAAYWLRSTLMAKNGSTTFDASTEISDVEMLQPDVDTIAPFTVVAPFPTGTRYLSFTPRAAIEVRVVNSGSLSGPETSLDYTTATDFTYAGITDPPSTAIVADFGEAYVSYGQVVSQHKAAPKVAGDVASVARVEDDPTLVGPNGRYDPDVYLQLATFPRAKYLAFHSGEMWAANLKDGGQHSVRWSAGSPAYRVWPAVSLETVLDNDSSEITGLFPFDQDMMVFKNDSIWRMVYTGLNALELNTYRGDKIVAGVGTVSNASIQAIKGHLVFLSEDGVYTFNGGRAEKISDRIQKYVDAIVPGRRSRAVAVNWKSKSCYLLAVSTHTSSINNLILVWDYKNDTWWVWDGFDAAHLFSVDDAADNEHIYIVDSVGRRYELGIGTHDYGTAITAYGITQRLMQSPYNKKIRNVLLLGTNTTRSFTLECQPNDQPFLGLDTTTVSFLDSAEKEYSVAQYNTSHYTEERERFSNVGELKGGEWLRLKLTHDLKDAPAVLSEAEVSFVYTGGQR